MEEKEHAASVGAKVKTKVPKFKNTDFSERIESLGGLGSVGAKKRRVLQLQCSSPTGKKAPDAYRASCLARPASQAASERLRSANVSRISRPQSSLATGSLRDPRSPTPATAADEQDVRRQASPDTGLDDWLKEVTLGIQSEAITFQQTRRATQDDPPAAAPPSTLGYLRMGVSPDPFAGFSNTVAEDDDDEETRSNGIDQLSLERFDCAQDFETHTPEQWLAICRQNPRYTQACVLQIANNEWVMKSCWVLDYDHTARRYLVELEDGTRKRVMRLALCFDAEDSEQFGRRVETCRKMKAHWELQTAFMIHIDRQPDEVAAPMSRQLKERFIRECLHKSHVDDAKNYIGSVRSLMTEVERLHELSMKLAKVKDDLLIGNGTPIARVREDSCFAALLANFLPKPVPRVALVYSEKAEQSAGDIVDSLSRHATLTASANSVTCAVWRRFGDVVNKHRILDTQRSGKTGPIVGAFTIDDFITHMVEHREDVIVMVERHWREHVVSEVLDKMSASENFFIDNPTKYLKAPLHRVLRRFDLILSSQMRIFIQYSVDDWVAFIRTFEPTTGYQLRNSIFRDNTRQFTRGQTKPMDMPLDEDEPWDAESLGSLQSDPDSVGPQRQISATRDTLLHRPLPPPLLKLRLTTNSDLDVVLEPEPDVLVSRILGLIDDITKVTSTVCCIEYELVPFCSLSQGLMFEIDDGGLQTLADAKCQTEEVLRKCLKGPQEIQELYQQYAYLLAEEADDLDPLHIDRMRTLIDEYLTAGEEIEKLTASVQKFPLFEVECHEIVDILARRAYELADMCMDAVDQNIKDRSSAVLHEWHSTHERILSNPEDEEELANLKIFMADIQRLVVRPLIDTTKHIHQQINMLADFSRPVDTAVVEQAFQLFSWPLQINSDVVVSERSLDSRKQRFMDKLEVEKQEFDKDLTRYRDDLAWVQTLNDYSMSMKVSTRIYKLKENLDHAKELVQSFMDREKLFSMEPSDYSELDTVINNYEPYYKLWVAAIDFKNSSEEWLNGPLSRLNAEELRQTVEEQLVSCLRTMQLFEGQANPKAVAQELQREIKDFRRYMPVIENICQDAFQPMHFAKLFDELDSDLDMEDGLTLQQLLDNGVLKHLETLAAIGAEAQKQYKLKTSLMDMKKEWKGVLLQVNPLRNTGTYILSGIEPIQNQVDEHIIKTQLIKTSPYAKPIEKEVKDWEAKLLYIHECLEIWLAVQHPYIALEPIFAVEDIQEQLPNESRRFDQVNMAWRANMQAVQENPNVLDVFDIENLLATFLEARKKLDIVHRGVEDFYTTKRLAFGRFFFLPNAELLDLLSQTKDPTTVQPHLVKCFVGIHRVRFNAPGEIIEAVMSVEGETVELEGEQVNVVEGERNGCVEKWLKELRNATVRCLVNITAKATSSYAAVTPYAAERAEWLRQWPCQVALAVGNVYWTQETALALDAGKIEDYHKQCNAQLVGLVTSLKQLTGAVSRPSTTALVIHSVHNRDIVSHLSKTKGITSKDYEWTCQMRYYWKIESQRCDVCMMHATLRYGFEYVGVGEQLVITPLTDRCYTALMAAFHMKRSASLEGAAGVGKTETAKSLAKALAAECFVFNCNSEINNATLAKFFKGAASSGIFCCFDELNHMRSDVLSCLAELLRMLHFSIAAKLKYFVLDDMELKLIPSCAVVSTFNPGFVGRSELPDNLKACIRPCAMMKPDFALIVEIDLYAHIVVMDAKNLARKIITSLRLAAELVSSQDHYDFGMRTLKAVLHRIRTLREEYGPTRNEAVLTLQAIKSVNLPKLTSDDADLFLSIVEPLFPNVEASNWDTPRSLKGLLQEVAQESGLQPEDEFIRKCAQLYQTLLARPGVLILGDPASGKTQVENVLAAALRKKSAQEGLAPNYASEGQVSASQDNTPVPVSSSVVSIAPVPVRDPLADRLGESHTWLPVRIERINPKAVTLGQLYGKLDENAHEWVEGIIVLAVRAAIAAEGGCRDWVVLDGPVDPQWMESMNSALDDCRSLCASSGEILPMPANLTMLFEVDDLQSGSPAAISRCGIVYLEERTVGWQAIFQSWLDNLPPHFKDLQPLISELVEASVEVLWDVVRKIASFSMPGSLVWLFLNFLHLYDALIQAEFPEDGDQDLSAKVFSLRDKEVKLDALFWFSVTWSFGSILDDDGQRQFNDFLKEFSTGAPVYDNYGLSCPKPSTQPIAKTTVPADGSYFDYYPSGQASKWEHWSKKVLAAEIGQGADMTEIRVPTAYCMRASYLMRNLLDRRRHVMFSGAAGTGKTVAIKREIGNLSSEAFTKSFASFCATTQVAVLEEVVSDKLEKRKKSTYGPMLGRAGVLFVDDINLPLKDSFGVQPPIEFLRQWVDAGGWHDSKAKRFKYVEDILLVSAQTQPGAGRPLLSPRWVRHSNFFHLSPMDSEASQKLFGSIMTWFFAGFSSSVSVHAQEVATATLELCAQASAALLQSPAKPQYCFNLHDVFKVHQGICQTTKASFSSREGLVKCWVHECLRVFQDRLSSSSDQDIITGIMQKLLTAHFKFDWYAVINEPLAFGRALAIGRQETWYAEVTDMPAVSEALRERLAEYNSVMKCNLDVVFFESAVLHLLRLLRVLHIPHGHAMLIGACGSGRKTLARLAVHVAGQELFQFESARHETIAEWQEDLKRLLMLAGGGQRPTTFLLPETHLPENFYMEEDLISILQDGQQHGLFNSEDKQQVHEMVAATLVKKNQENASEGTQAPPPTPAQCLEYLASRVLQNLHLVLVYSALGDTFRKRMRMFPSLLSRSTVDWYMPWPESALRGVAEHVLRGFDAKQLVAEMNADPPAPLVQADEHDVDSPTRTSPPAEEAPQPPAARAPLKVTTVTQALLDNCLQMHKSAVALAGRYRRELGRWVHITPSAYIQLILTFKELAAQKQDELFRKRDQFDTAVNKLLKTEDQVVRMAAKLDSIKPVLQTTVAELSELTTGLKAKQEVETGLKHVVEKAQQEYTRQAQKVRALKESVQADLNVALPPLHASVDALKSLKKSELKEVKEMKNPPMGVILASKAVCLMLSIKAKKVKGPDGRTPVDDYWEPSKKKVWGDGKLMDKIQKVHEKLSNDVMDHIRPFADDANFEPEVVRPVSSAAANMIMWIRAMIAYNQVLRDSEPMQKKLDEAEYVAATLNLDLEAKKDELKALQTEIVAQTKDLTAHKTKKDEFQIAVETTTKRKTRAEKLVATLGGEKQRWSEDSFNLSTSLKTLAGDLILTSGMIAYLGSFVGKYRQQKIEEWTGLLQAKQLLVAEEFSLRKVIGTEVAVTQWIVDLLPRDQNSIDNALMLSQSQRWPLMIDPQAQAVAWIRKRHTNNLKVMRPSQPNYLKELEMALSMGKPALLEHMGEKIDCSLEPLLQKAFFKPAGRREYVIRLGETTVEYKQEFRFYMATPLHNPHFSPELFRQVTVLNFMATPESLQEHLLGVIVSKEEPDVERKRNSLFVEYAHSKAQLHEVETRIIELMTTGQANILDDDPLIETLAQSKQAAGRIEERVLEMEKAQSTVLEGRTAFTAVATRASSLFFVVTSLHSLSPMYQYSLPWYLKIIEEAILTSERFERNHGKRVASIQDKLARVLYKVLCQSLFEKDKLAVALLICLRCMESDSELNLAEKACLFSLGSLPETGATPVPRPDGNWVSQAVWIKCCELEKLKRAPWTLFTEHFKANLDGWKAVVDSPQPMSQPWPSSLKDVATPLQKALLMTALRPDVGLMALREMILGKLGRFFLDVPHADLEKAHAESDSSKPLLLLLKPGADATHAIKKLGSVVGMDSDRQLWLSLGDGQVNRAEALIAHGLSRSAWVVFQNLHVVPAWMSKLEALVLDLPADRHGDGFRLWLTAAPFDLMPGSVARSSLKVVLEPPQGLRANLLRAFGSFDADWFMSACGGSEDNQRAFRKLFFGLCFFHAALQERAKYGALGWNHTYQSSDSELETSALQLEQFIDESGGEPQNLPLARLIATIVDINYGARCIDNNDRKTLKAMLKDIFVVEILGDSYKFSESGNYQAPPTTGLEGYIHYIENLPSQAAPEAVGLHVSAYDVAMVPEINAILTGAGTLDAAISGTQSSADDGDGNAFLAAVHSCCEHLRGALHHEPFDLAACAARWPEDVKDHTNTLLMHELMRYNRLTAALQDSLWDLGRASNGTQAMREDLSPLAEALVRETVPAAWKNLSYPSEKPLTSYILDLCARLRWWQDWLDNGPPDIHWLASFYWPQEFLTTVMLQCSRKTEVPIDALVWQFVITSPNSALDDLPYGAYVNGLYLHGARWHTEERILTDCPGKTLRFELPTIQFMPIEVSKEAADRRHCYRAPLYRTSSRKTGATPGTSLGGGGSGARSTRSTNFILELAIPIVKYETERFWRKRGVACLAQLDT
eukprot:TRINITY_DN20312_c0_g5_i1.p1 TRINITY_DN20312_c0_g5~~TRINITY_DN20312_c0_g5_i1.p1  ORF type:complete len:4379 (-),score=957.45 TRINITY_DN20312_c0_g5_i1:503-13639(-)